MSEPKITLDEVRHVAHLARLALRPDELETMRAQLDGILNYMADLDAIDVADVPPTYHAVPLDAPLREDVVRPSLARDEVFASAPAVDSGAFAVPKVLGGET